LTHGNLLFDIETQQRFFLQHYLTMFGGTVSIPFIICPALCMEPNDPARFANNNWFLQAI
jgi:xanthine/uracil permease